MIQLVDTHCHLDFPELAAQQAEVIARARASGVARMITISTHASRFEAARKIAETYDDIYCSVGVHPHHSGEDAEQVDEAWLVNAAQHPKVVGIGESGLDYYYNNSPKEAQQRSFRAHIQACLKTDLPLIVHSRDADEDTTKILKEEGGGRLRGLLHCFSSTRMLAEEAVALGFYISISGIVTFKKSDELRAIVKDVPLDRILVETDAPFLAPMPHRGKPNEPAYVIHTAACVAEVKGISVEELSKATTANALKVFNRMSAL
jgi:TatD DNase family protein